MSSPVRMGTPLHRRAVFTRCVCSASSRPLPPHRRAMGSLPVPSVFPLNLISGNHVPSRASRGVGGALFPLSFSLLCHPATVHGCDPAVGNSPQFSFWIFFRQPFGGKPVEPSDVPRYAASDCVGTISGGHWGFLLEGASVGARRVLFGVPPGIPFGGSGASFCGASLELLSGPLRGGIR